MTSIRPLAVLFLFVLGAAQAAAEWHWLEGEAATRSSVRRHPSWYDKVKTEVLSGGEWISNFSDSGAGEAGFEFEIREAGEFTLWLRANPLGKGMTYRVDGGPPVTVSFAEKRGEQNIAEDNKPDLRFICWTKAGTPRLEAGKHAITFRFDGSASHHGALDCFLITNEPFVPQGATRPGEQTTAAADSWFPLIADDDPFSPDSVIDMSGIIEAPAGKFGRVLAKGKDLVFEQHPDKPIKLWGCGANLEAGKFTREQLARRAKYLRKFGVNLVRQHPLFDEITTDGKIDPVKLDDYDWWFAELKKQGIYTQWSVFYHVPITPEEAQEYDLGELFEELPPLGNSSRLRDTYGLATAEPVYVYLRYPVLHRLLDHKNPFTGLTYARDPALAVLEMQNEDSIFFWNPLGALSEGKKWPKHSRRLREAFFRWAAKRYGSEAALAAVWGGLRPGEWESSQLEIAGPWEMDVNGPRGKWNGQQKRAADYTLFLTEHQRGIYEGWQQRVRQLGYAGVTVTTNWLAGSPAQDAANIFTDCVGDMIDRHNYAGGGAGVHNVQEGGIHAESHLGQPGAHLFMIGLKQVEDKPFSISEWTMGPPNQWKLECAPLFAFYGMGLQGWDASAHFLQTGWRLGDGWPGTRTYATDTPHYLGQFPALAFALHRGHLTEGPIVAARRLTEAEVFSGRTPLKQDYYDGEKLRRVEGGTPLEVFAMGRATIKFGGRAPGELADLGKFRDSERGVIRSATGEMTWDYGAQCVTVHAPKTQAIIGRAAERKIELPGVTAEIKTAFVSLIFTPLDDRPLGESRRILITALARDRQTGARYSSDGTRLESVGTAPLLLEPVQATLKFAGSPPSKIVALDCYGVPLPGSQIAVRPDGSFGIDGTHSSYYYQVTR